MGQTLELTEKQTKLIELLFKSVTREAIESKPHYILKFLGNKFIQKLTNMGLIDPIWLERSNCLVRIDEECFKRGNTFVPIWSVFKSTQEQEHYQYLSNNFLVFRKKEGSELVVTTFKNYNVEKAIAYEMKALNRKPSNVDQDEVDKYLKEFEEEFFELNEEQKQAVKNCLSENMTFLTGSAGSGKTTTLSAIVYVLRKMCRGFQIVSPTGKAAKRASDVTNTSAKTIHSFLRIGESDEDVAEDKQNITILEGVDFLIVDEFSMLSITLLSKVLSSKTFNNIIFVGDDKQLPSVEPGNFIDMIVRHSKDFKVSHLNKIVRQTEDSGILNVANNIIEDTPELIKWDKMKDAKFIDSRVTSLDTLVNNYVKLYNKYGHNGVVMLSPTKKNEKGTVELNVKIRDILNPWDITKHEVTLDGVVFREGDLVINAMNQSKIPVGEEKYKTKRVFNKKTLRWSTHKILEEEQNEVYIPNGKVGTISSITMHGSQLSEAILLFDEVEFKFKRKDLFGLLHGYVMTIHKSQGSEYKNVILIADKEHEFQLKENIIYTGITRAKENIYIYGNINSFNRGAIVKDSKVRKSWFYDMYKELG